MKGFLFFLAGLVQVFSCHVSQKDQFIIKKILEDQLINDCTTILTLAGIFFEDREKPLNSVKVKYVIQFPENDSCKRNCPCWIEACDTENCDPGYCCFQRDLLWGRVPLYVQDSIFRQLSMCSLVVGGMKEKSITIPLNVSDRVQSMFGATNCEDLEFPCSWCASSSGLDGKIITSKLGVDTTVTLAQAISPMDKALLTLTSKLQGYAIKAEKLEWLTYSSDLDFGYSEIYQIGFTLEVRLILFCIYYFSFQIVIFMLMYKNRYQIYNNVQCYLVENSVNRSLFWSFILTTLLAFTCILVISILADGICISVLQIIMLFIALVIGFSHTFVACFCMKKAPLVQVFPKYVNDRHVHLCKNLNFIFLKLVFVYLFLLPHIGFFFLVNFVVNFIASPFSYMLLFMYFCVSNIFIWVANAIGIRLLFPLPCTKGSIGNRRHLFAVFLIAACNCLNFSTWSFIEVYFYDRRAQATSFITILPGVVFTLLGWYLSGDLVKLFDKVLLKSTNLQDDNHEESEQLITNPDITENVGTLRRMSNILRIVKHPTTLITQNTNEPPNDEFQDTDAAENTD